MIASTGSLNGAPLNGHALNGGGFVVSFSAEGAATLDSEATFSRRARPGVRTMTELAVAALATRRHGVRAAGAIDPGLALRLTRRRPASPSGAATLATGAIVVRRVTFGGRAGFALAAALRVRWRDFGHPWPARRIVLRPDPRALVEPAAARGIVVPADDTPPVAPHRRRASA